MKLTTPAGLECPAPISSARDNERTLGEGVANGRVLAERWFIRGRPPEPLATLFPAAMEALEDEDRALRSLFNNCPRSGEAELGEHPGLAYGLFETTLVYLVFKAWMRHTHVDWESRYSDEHTRRADLVVLRPRLYFEAKWWGSLQDKVLTAIGTDVRRLREPTDANGRYFLTFWWNFDDDAPKDKEEIEGFDRHLGEEGLHPRYYARFRTMVRHKRENAAHFAMCAFEIR